MNTSIIHHHKHGFKAVSALERPKKSKTTKHKGDQMNKSGSSRKLTQHAHFRPLRIGPTLIGLLLTMSVIPFPSRAATAPVATLVYTTDNNAPIPGGMTTIGSSGVTYFSTLSTATTRANVTALNFSGTQPKWKFIAPGDGPDYNMFAVPALDASGQKLYIGSDNGVFYCRNTSDGTSAIGWTDFTVPGTGDRKIRSAAALDPNNPLGSK